MQNEGDIASNLKRFLKTYRTIPSQALNGKTPAEMFTGRKFRTDLDMLRPKPEPSSVIQTIASVQTSKHQAQMKENFDKHHGAKARSFEPKDPVYVRMQKQNKQYWTHGTVKNRNNVMYDVEIDNRTTSRHANQLRRRHAHNQQRTEDVYDGLMLAFEMPLPKRKTKSSKGEGTRKVKTAVQALKPRTPINQEFLTPEQRTPILMKMETIFKKLRTMEGRAVSIEEKDVLMESIRDLEEEVGRSDPEILDILKQTKETMQKTNTVADEISLLFNDLSIQEELTSALLRPANEVRPLPAPTQEKSLADELVEAEKQNEPPGNEESRPAQENSEQDAPSQEAGPAEPVQAPQLELPTGNSASIEITGQEAASSSVRRELFRADTPLSGGMDLDPEPLERSMFDNQNTVEFSSPEERRLAPLTRVRKQPSFLEVTHTRSPGYKSRRKR